MTNKNKSVDRNVEITHFVLILKTNIKKLEKYIYDGRKSFNKYNLLR